MTDSSIGRATATSALPGRRRRLLELSLLAACIVNLLTACMTMVPKAATGGAADGVRAAAVAKPHARRPKGRSGPDGRPQVADRGIGGTGATGNGLPASETADRGIGGTGIGDSDIGGTGTGGPGAAGTEAAGTDLAGAGIASPGKAALGIIGVITGFGSVFVDGVEIQYDDAASVDVDGAASSRSVLRAGQLVAVRAEGLATEPHAAAIEVRSVVIGRIEALGPDDGMLLVAGQSVSVPDGAWGASRFGPGDWVRVSGLRRADGTIVASRLDAAPAGVLLVRGPVERADGTVRVGRLELSPAAAAGMKDGDFVLVSGDYEAGRGHVNAVASDILASDPAGYFGASAGRLFVQAFVTVDQGAIWINGLKVAARAGVATEPRHEGIAVVELERGANGSYVAVGLREADYRDQAGGPAGRRDGAHDAQASRWKGHAPPSSPADSGSSGWIAGGRLTTAFAGIPFHVIRSLPSLASPVATMSAATAPVAPAVPPYSAAPGGPVVSSLETGAVASPAATATAGPSATAVPAGSPGVAAFRAFPP
jgi:hypothetical protein